MHPLRTSLIEARRQAVAELIALRPETDADLAAQATRLAVAALDAGETAHRALSLACELLAAGRIH